MLGLATDGNLYEMTVPHINEKIDEEEDWGDGSTPHGKHSLKASIIQIGVLSMKQYKAMIFYFKF